MKKFLFLLDELPPTKSANGICAEKVMRSLSADGYDVKCILWNANDNNRFDTYLIPDKPWNRFVSRRLESNNLFSRIALLLGRIIHRIKRYIILPVWPVQSFSTVRKFQVAAQKLIEKHGITDVIAVNYPGETLLAMKRLKKKYGDRIRTVMYPLDVTLFGVPCGGRLEKKVSRKFSAHFMRHCARYADTVLVLENSQTEFESIFSTQERERFVICGIPLLESNGMIEVAENGLDQTGSEKTIHCIYAGNLLGRIRSPEALFTNLDRIAYNTSRRISFDLYGQMDAVSETILKSKIRHFDFINHGWIAEEELHGVLRKADILLNIGNEEKHLIPSKMFKYMSYGKPILHQCLIPKDPCIPYLTTYGNSLILHGDELQDEKKKNSAVLFIESAQTIAVDVSTLFPRCEPQYTARLLEN
jgi:glycosyltransferase involved in cell wall biosynthesis